MTKKQRPAGHKENAMNQKIRDAFKQGWADCEAGTDGLTARVVGEDYPDYSAEQIDAYLNGADDCANNDRFRLDFLETQ